MVCSLQKRRGNFRVTQSTRITVLTRPAPEASKEVARVIKNPTQTTPMTQQWINERFGMPTRGLAFGSTTLPSGVSGTSACAATARERQIVAIEVVTKGHVDVAVRDLAYVPGTSAWSPPIC
jgi:hypothetical protein